MAGAISFFRQAIVLSIHLHPWKMQTNTWYNVFIRGRKSPVLLQEYPIIYLNFTAMKGQRMAQISKTDTELAPNSGQDEAVRTHRGPVLIISCPGSGKTTTLIRRIHSMIGDGIDPGHILMVTFTNAAAEDMQKKYQNMYGRNAGVTFQTIHSLAFNLLRAEGRFSQGDILTDHEARLFFIDSLKKYSWVSDPWELSRSLMTEISCMRNSGAALTAYVPRTCANPAFANLYRGYAAFKNERHKIDFDDMLFECRELLVRNRNVLEKWRKVFQYIQCDEYQDTNPVQRDILYLLAGNAGNLCVVGDDDQSIYGFRGADPRIMADFGQDFPDAKVITLDTNYRSAKSIVDAAANLISGNEDRFGKRFISARGEAGAIGNVTYRKFRSRKEELDEIIQLAGNMHEAGTPWTEIAVLFRTNQQAQLPVMAMSAAGIPFYTTETVQSIYDGWIFGDIRAYADLSMGNGNNDDILRVLNHPMRYLSEDAFRGVSFSYRDFQNAIGYLKKDEYWKYERADDKIHDWIETLGPLVLRPDDPPDKLFRALLGPHGVHYGDYIADYAKFRNTEPREFDDVLDELRAESARFGTIREWFAYADDYRRKLAEERKKGKKRSGITLTTMHKAKGLEWKTVFIIDVHDGLVPYEQKDEETDLEEERRLFYVAMTRAKDNLYIMNPGGKESLFVRELRTKSGAERESFYHEGAGAYRDVAISTAKRRGLAIGGAPSEKLEQGDSRSGAASSGKLKPVTVRTGNPVPPGLRGKKVRHRTFGDGVIVGTDRDLIIVDFSGQQKRFLYPFAVERGFLRLVE